MKYTNKFGLPDAFVSLVTQDHYNKGESDFTTTGLLRPARIVALERLHWDEIEEDVSDLVWRMSGSVKHVVLERIAKANPERYIVEKRFYHTIDGFKIGGQLDLYDKQDLTLFDWKETSVWKAIMGDQADWEAQANINRFILKHNGIETKALKNIAFFKDWKRTEAKDKPDYPACPIKVFPLKEWDDEKTESFIRQRIQAHLLARQTLPECSPEERWAKADSWAVKKDGRKTAVRVYDNEAMAEAHVKSAGSGHSVEFRAGQSTRCESYCQCAPYCSQFQSLKAKSKSTDKEGNE